MELDQRRPMSAGGNSVGGLRAILGNAAGEKAHPPGTAPRLTNPICQAQDLAEKCENLDNGPAEKHFSCKDGSDTVKLRSTNFHAMPGPFLRISNGSRAVRLRGIGEFIHRVGLREARRNWSGARKQSKGSSCRKNDGRHREILILGRQQ